MELSFSSSLQYQYYHSVIICPMQSVRSDTSILFDNGSIGDSFHKNDVTITHVHREVQSYSPEHSMMEKGPK